MIKYKIKNHVWMDWEIVSEKEIQDTNSIAKIIIQKRKCPICGLVEYNKQKINYD